MLIYGELVGVGVLAGAIPPPFMGIMGVWLSVPITQVILAILGGILLRAASHAVRNAEGAALEKSS